MTTDRTPAIAAATSAPPPTRRSRRVQSLVLIVVAFLLVLGGLVGGVLAFLTYDRATAIDRSTPRASSLQFLDAAVIQRDLARVSLFVCADWSAAEALTAVGPPLDPRLSVSWEDMTTAATGATATVSVNAVFRVAVAGGNLQDTEVWTLQLMEQDGWRVCGLTREPSLNP